MEHCDRLLTNWFWQIAFSEHCTIDTVFFQQVVEKKMPDERVGVVVKCDGKYQVLHTGKESLLFPCTCNWIVFTSTVHIKKVIMFINT